MLISSKKNIYIFLTISSKNYNIVMRNVYLSINKNIQKIKGKLKYS